MQWILTRGSALLLATLAVGTVSAHEGETHADGGGSATSVDPLAIALIVIGILGLGAGLYLRELDDVEDMYTVSVLGVGALGLVGAGVTFLL